uniref:YjeF N-terminal domain-containing protein n=1 Tax=Gracilinema caldarium TaxID=215591 RepID=A0A7C3I258_9SPIR
MEDRKIYRRCAKMIIADVSEARTIDEKAMAEWGLPSAVLVEAAGRECAQALIAQWHRVVPNHTHYKDQSPKLVLAAGTGNNGADGMVLLKTLILKNLCDVPHCVMVLSKPESELQVSPPVSSTPRSQAFQVLKKMGIPVLVWQEMAQADRGTLFSKADLIIDALTGTGLSGPLKGPVAELVFAINQSRKENPNQRVISLDVPSGLSDSWDPPDPVVEADLTLAIEPIKACLFKPAARPKAGHILPITGIFPDILLVQGPKNRLISLATLSSDREAVQAFSVQAEAYKHQRGVVQIFAGAPGTSGAAILAGRGAPPYLSVLA